MSDIGERLRDLALDYPNKPWISEAADEIERLERRIVQLLEISAVEIHKRNNEIAQLREDRDQWRATADNLHKSIRIISGSDRECPSCS